MKPKKIVVEGVTKGFIIYGCQTCPFSVEVQDATIQCMFTGDTVEQWKLDKNCPLPDAGSVMLG